MKPLAFIDIETDNLLYDVSTVWCAVVYLEDEKTYLIYPSELCPTVEDWLAQLEGYKLVAHNGIAFDFPALKKLHGFQYDLKQENIEDTLVLSYLLYPDRVGHSLESWGEQLGFKKGSHDDWSKFSEEMLNYCIRDVDVLRRVHYALLEEQKDWDWSQAIDLEYAIAHSMMEQEQHGVLFDVDKAEALLFKVEEEIQEIERKALAEIPKKAVQSGATVSKPFLKNGEYSKQVKEWLDETNT